METYRHFDPVCGQMSRIENTLKPRETARHASGRWNAVGSLPLDQALQWMELDGWSQISSSVGEIFSYYVLAYEQRIVRLYARNSVVRMIHVANAN